MSIRYAASALLSLVLLYGAAVSAHGGEGTKPPPAQPRPDEVKGEPKKAEAPKTAPAVEFRGKAQVSLHPYKMEKGEVYRITVKGDGFMPQVLVEGQRGYDPTLSAYPFLASDGMPSPKPAPRREAQMIFLPQATRVHQIQVDYAVGSEIGPGANAYTLRIERASFKPQAGFGDQLLALGEHAKKFEKGKTYGISVTGKGIAPIVQIMDGSRSVMSWANGRWFGFGPDAEYIMNFNYSPARTGDYRLLVGLGPVTEKRAVSPQYIMRIVELKMALSVQGQITVKDPIYPRRGGRHKVHEVKLESGKSYQIELISLAFDPYLFVEDSAGKLLVEDDDSAGNLNARLVFVPKTTDTYRLVATTFEQAVPNRPPGPYTLTVVDSSQGVSGTPPLSEGTAKSKN